MNVIKSIKIVFCLAVMLLVAKPFLGFSVLSQVNTIKSTNIYIKAFTKRKQEYVDDSEYDAATYQKKLAGPVTQFLLRFAFLLDIILPFAFVRDIANRILRRLHISVPAREPSYLLYGTLLI